MYAEKEDDILKAALEVHVRILYGIWLLSLLPNISVYMEFSKSRTNIFSILKLYSVLKSSSISTVVFTLVFYLALYAHMYCRVCTSLIEVPGPRIFTRLGLT